MLNGVHIESAGVDAISVFDRLLEAGRPYALRLAGQEALELLALESGTPIPGLDFAPARSDDATEPSAAMLGLESGDATRVLRGVAWDGDGPATGTALFAYDPATRVVGEITRSAYSPALGAVIGFCIVDVDVSAPGTGVVLRVIGPHGATDIPARIAALPFLP